jgi:hypothetical protein
MVFCRRLGGGMQVGDLVTWVDGDVVGIVIRQMGVVDRWWIQWVDGQAFAANGCNLEVV